MTSKKYAKCGATIQYIIFSYTNHTADAARLFRTLCSGVGVQDCVQGCVQVFIRGMKVHAAGTCLPVS